MRLYLKLTKNNQIIPFNYQSYLTGAIHKWIGENNTEHNSLSMYSFSWLQNVEVKSKGVILTRDSYFFISAHDEKFLKKILNGILTDSFVCFDSHVSDVEISETPQFASVQKFVTASPVFIKRRFENEEKHITYDDPRSSDFLTETLKKRLQAANLSTNELKVRFDDAYPNPQTKIIRYKEISNRVNVCPVVIEGTPEQIAFAWNVGVGNSTGIGFGALK